MRNSEIIEERNELTNRIVSSHHLKRLVVAGPGTGKTFTFTKITERAQGSCLVLTFLNNLKNELEMELGDKASVYFPWVLRKAIRKTRF